MLAKILSTLRRHPADSGPKELPLPNATLLINSNHMQIFFSFFLPISRIIGRSPVRTVSFHGCTAIHHIFCFCFSNDLKTTFFCPSLQALAIPALANYHTKICHSPMPAIAGLFFQASPASGKMEAPVESIKPKQNGF